MRAAIVHHLSSQAVVNQTETSSISHSVNPELLLVPRGDQVFQKTRSLESARSSRKFFGLLESYAHPHLLSHVAILSRHVPAHLFLYQKLDMHCIQLSMRRGCLALTRSLSRRCRPHSESSPPC